MGVLGYVDSWLVFLGYWYWYTLPIGIFGAYKVSGISHKEDISLLDVSRLVLMVVACIVPPIGVVGGAVTCWYYVVAVVCSGIDAAGSIIVFRRRR